MPQPRVLTVLPCWIYIEAPVRCIYHKPTQLWVLGLINQLSSLANKKSGTWENSGPFLNIGTLGFSICRGIASGLVQSWMSDIGIWEPWELLRPRIGTRPLGGTICLPQTQHQRKSAMAWDWPGCKKGAHLWKVCEKDRKSIVGGFPFSIKIWYLQISIP